MEYPYACFSGSYTTTVSASISRSESWYRREEKAFYTSRYYPSLETELAQSKAFKQEHMSCDRVSRLYDILRPTARLAGLRLTLKKRLEKGDDSGSKEVSLVVQKCIQELNQAMLNGQFLQEMYCFDPDLVDQIPQVRRVDEAFARSGLFTETVLSLSESLEICDNSLRLSDESDT